MYGGSQSYLPLKVDQSGVIAVIFAVSLLAVPITVASFAPQSTWAQKMLHFWGTGSWIYQLVYAALIIFFCYFYNSVSFNPTDLADNMRKSGGFIPGYRPGEPYRQNKKERSNWCATSPGERRWPRQIALRPR